MPLPRRLPRRGFVNAFKTKYSIFNLKQLEVQFSVGEVVSEKTLREKGLIKGKGAVFIKVLGSGTLSKKLTVQVHSCSRSVVAAIKRVGGAVEQVKENGHGRTTT